MTNAIGYTHHTELNVVRPPWYWRNVAISSRYYFSVLIIIFNVNYFFFLKNRIHILLGLKKLSTRFLSTVSQGVACDVFLHFAIWSEKVFLKYLLSFIIFLFIYYLFSLYL